MTGRFNGSTRVAGFEHADMMKRAFGFGCVVSANITDIDL